MIEQAIPLLYSRLKRLKMKTRLTDLAVKKLATPEVGQVTYWDQTTPGFGLRCSSKSKSFVVMFGEKRRLKTPGRYPILSLSDARREARLFLSEASFGKHQETKILFSTARDKFLTDCEHRLRPITVREYRRYLNYFAFKGILQNIERSDIFANYMSFAPLPATKTMLLQQ